MEVTTSNNNDTICVSESWLNSFIAHGEVINDRFVLFRKDRDNDASSHNRGGGVFIAVKRNILAELSINRQNIEQIFARIKCTDGDVVVGCIYIPPHSMRDIYAEHATLFRLFKLNSKTPRCSLWVTIIFLVPSLPPDDCENLLYNDLLLARCTQRNNHLLDLC